jgi:hypothetical protein
MEHPLIDDPSYWDVLPDDDTDLPEYLDDSDVQDDGHYRYFVPW